MSFASLSRLPETPEAIAFQSGTQDSMASWWWPWCGESRQHRCVTFSQEWREFDLRQRAYGHGFWQESKISGDNRSARVIAFWQRGRIWKISGHSRIMVVLTEDTTPSRPCYRWSPRFAFFEPSCRSIWLLILVRMLRLTYFIKKEGLNIYNIYWLIREV